MDSTLKLLQELTSINGVSGYEHEVAQYIETYMQSFSTITKDKLGSIICEKKGAANSPKVMLSGHMDEIGFMVRKIDKNGFIYFTTLGGWWSQVLLAQKVHIITNKGLITGVIGSKPPHILDPEEREKPVKTKDMFIDVGAKRKEETVAMGIRPGDSIVPAADFTLMGNNDSILAKAFDDRVGCALFMEVMAGLKNEEHPNTLYGVGSVQEEIGLRGAKTASALIEPDVAFALEVGVAGDMPGIKEAQALEKLGGGPVLLLYDSSMFPNRKLRDWVCDLADQHQIPYQFDFMEGGGTDAGSIHLHHIGVPSLVLAVPTRYIHSHYGIISYQDYQQTKKLLTLICKNLDEKTVKSFCY